jgi:WD40 repeat protein
MAKNFGVKANKFKHVFANEPTKGIWDGVKLTKNAWDSNYSSASSNWIAMCWDSAGGGSVGILDARKPGKLEPTKVPLLTGHKGAVLDLDFNPFNDDILATSSEDLTIKIWNIKGGFEGHKSDAVQTLSGHGKKVGAIRWHPTADNVIASAGADYVVKVWDVETGTGKYKSDGATNLIQSVDWNYDASLLVTNSKDKTLRIIDPRQQSVVASAESHVGVKGGRALWLGKHPLVASVGFGSGASREYKVYDSRKMDGGALATTSLESAAGVIMPFYDEDADLLFLAGKGDGAIKFYEVNPEEEPKSIISHLGQFTSNNATSAACSLPRRSCNVQEVEIIRLYKITKGTVVPLHFQVPRRSDLFADDVYVPARGDEPALSKDAWFSGENATPKLVSLEGGFVAKEKAVGNFTQTAQKDEDTPKDLKGAYEALKKKVAELEAELEKRDAKIAELESK